MLHLLVQMDNDKALRTLGIENALDRGRLIFIIRRVRNDDYKEHRVRQKGNDARPRFKWAVKFDSGEMHRYTIEQIQEKFGVDEVQVGMELNHKTRGRATIMVSFTEQRGSVEMNEVFSSSVCKFSCCAS